VTPSPLTLVLLDTPPVSPLPCCSLRRNLSLRSLQGHYASSSPFVNLGGSFFFSPPPKVPYLMCLSLTVNLSALGFSRLFFRKPLNIPIYPGLTPTRFFPTPPRQALYLCGTPLWDLPSIFLVFIVTKVLTASNLHLSHGTGRPHRPLPPSRENTLSSPPQLSVLSAFLPHLSAKIETPRLFCPPSCYCTRNGFPSVLHLLISVGTRPHFIPCFFLWRQSHPFSSAF